MKQIKIIGLAVLLLASSALAENLILDEEFGLAEKVEIQSYNGKKKTVKVKIGTEYISRSLDSFPKTARKEIMAWVADENFLSSSTLRIEVDEDVWHQEFKPDSRGMGTHTYGEVQRISYIVRLENRGFVAIDNVQVECQVFYEATEGDREEKRKIVLGGALDVLPEKDKVFRSKRVKLRDLKIVNPDYRTEDTIYYGEKTVYLQDELRGVLFVIRRTDRNGAEVSRELEKGNPPDALETSSFILFQEPEDLKAVAEKVKQKELKAASGMVMVPGGKLLRERNEITLDSFWIGSHEVTQSEIVKVYNNGLEAREIDGEGGMRGDFWVSLSHGGDGLIRRTSESAPLWNGVFYAENRDKIEKSLGAKYLPVIKSTWYGAVYYCNAKSKEEGLTPCYTKDGKEWVCDFSANGYRLPTEAEWEYAARGGASGHFKDYSGSDNLDEVGWYEGNCEEGVEPQRAHHAEPNHTHNVGDKRPNELGLYDMSGNAPEWCNDWYGDYPRRPQPNPVGCEMPRKRKEQLRVIRGGGWNSSEEECRVSTRSKGHPEEDTAGFRVVRAVFSDE
ncbi:formylglycine-generating enzyme family protein [Tichowtungia aerotolerans]|uniref:SUMF1/EgtB/PvdO family nonheme iron enzyme n=1 Tax=Tichowtungia aerotolerans TaxID=2697043 RepID=A0A6P1MBN0_9BACT|nr:SUMF1/EgtB/PvdO family nonheme iron enzyme [Tichowtungia aerotolerans]QHI69498.1 SUMF1/EgtB/PvdO family nonheme iron enzyme [Tichowtungia aerotolerans]